MTYTAPTTFTDTVATTSEFNTYIRDNERALKDPPSQNYEANELGDYSVSGDVWTDLTNMEGAIDTTGGDIFVGVTFSGKITSSPAFINIELDGTRIVDNATRSGVCTVDSTSPNLHSFVWLITGLSAGSHTVKIQARVNLGTLTIYAGAGTANYDIHPQFWVRELT